MTKYHVRTALDKCRSWIAYIKYNRDKYKRPNDCLRHLTLREIELSDQLYQLTH